MPTASVIARSDRRRNRLEHQRETAGALERLRFLDQPAPRRRRAALRLVAAEKCRRLWRQPDVTHDWNARVDDGADPRERAARAFELHRIGAALLDEPDGVLDRRRSDT